MLFFATGAAWAGLGADLILGNLHKMYAIWVFYVFYFISVALLLVSVQFFANVWLTRCLCLMIGASLFSCMLCSMQTSIFWLDASNTGNDPGND